MVYATLGCTDNTDGCTNVHMCHALKYLKAKADLFIPHSLHGVLEDVNISSQVVRAHAGTELYLVLMALCSRPRAASRWDRSRQSPVCRSFCCRLTGCSWISCSRGGGGGADAVVLQQHCSGLAT